MAGQGAARLAVGLLGKRGAATAGLRSAESGLRRWGHGTAAKTELATLASTGALDVEACGRFSRVVHTEEKEIKLSGLPLVAAGHAGGEDAGAEESHENIVDQLHPVRYEVVDHVPWLCLSNATRRMDATVFLAQVFRELANHQVNFEYVSTSVSNVAVALPAALEGDRLESLKAALAPLGVSCRYDSDGALLRCHSDVLPRGVLKHALLQAFVDHGLHSHMLFSSSAGTSKVSVLVPRGEVEEAEARLRAVLA